MRWRPKSGPRDGDVRIKRRFLWVPMEMGGEVRWLEFARIRCVFAAVGRAEDRYRTGWRPTGWVD